MPPSSRHEQTPADALPGPARTPSALSIQAADTQKVQSASKRTAVIAALTNGVADRACLLIRGLCQKLVSTVGRRVTGTDSRNKSDLLINVNFK